LETRRISGAKPSEEKITAGLQTQRSEIQRSYYCPQGWKPGGAKSSEAKPGGAKSNEAKFSGARAQ